MYGLVNKAVEDLVVSNHGSGTWEAIKARAGVEVESFISNESYPDSVTYDLVGAASEVLGVPAREILVAFGEHWVLQTAVKSYGAMLKAGGRDLRDFLINLPNFHTRVMMIFQNLKPPRFECAEVAEESLLLRYFTHREGLADFVVGLVQGLGKYYGTPAVCELVESRAANGECDVFRVTWSNPS